jgi:phosphotriesterase-related protein
MKKNEHFSSGQPSGFEQQAEPFTRRSFLKTVGIGTAAAVLPSSTVLAAFDKTASFVHPTPADKLISSGSFSTAKAIPTATGQIFPEQMGITSVHEHIVMPTDPVQREKSFAFAVSELKKAKALGLNTIMDVGPPDEAKGIKEVSEASGVNVVCCTGFYLLKDEQQTMSVEDFENHMRREVEEGIQGTQIRPGVIKLSTRKLPITDAEKNLLIAGARIQKRYGLTICTHAVSGCAEQQQILERAGADLKHCYFSHVEATFGWGGRSVEQEIDYLQGVVEKGSSLSFNNFGNWNHTKPTDLARIILELTKRGYDDRMVATIDLTWTFANGNIKILWGDTNEEGDDRTYSYPLRKVVPWMKEKGLSKETIDKFMIDNPRRLFTW